MEKDFEIFFLDEPAGSTGPERLSEYARGQLSRPERARMERHLARDWSARQMAEQLEETWALLDAWSDAPPPADAADRFAARLREVAAREQFSDAPSVLSRRPLPLQSFVAPLAWAAVLVLVALSAFYSFEQIKPPAPPDVVAQKKADDAHQRLVQVASTNHLSVTPRVVDPSGRDAEVPASLRAAYPRTVAKLIATEERDAMRGFFNVNNPRLDSVMVAEDTGIMLDQIHAVLDLGSSHELKQAMASVAALDYFISRMGPETGAAPDAEPAADDDSL